MKYHFDENRNLVITIDKDEQAELRQMKAESEDSNFDSDDTLHAIFEPLTHNDAFNWIQPEDIGALTSAPILGLKGPGYEVPADEAIDLPFNQSGRDGHKGTQYIEVIEQAWGFMDYQVISVQERLLETGKAVFQPAFERAFDARQYAKPHWRYTGDGQDPEYYQSVDEWIDGMPREAISGVSW